MFTDRPTIYGVDCLKLESRDVRKLSFVWNIAFRWIFGINWYVHMRQYLKHYGTMSFAFLVDMRFLMFIFKL